MIRTAALAAALALAAAPAVGQPAPPAQPPTAAPAPTQDPAQVAAGKDQFSLQCTFCHDGTSGPDLTGVSGRKVAAAGFAYSEGLKAKGATDSWTDENLDVFLKNPTGYAPGTKMTMAVPDDAGRAAIIAYLKTLK